MNVITVEGILLYTSCTTAKLTENLCCQQISITTLGKHNSSQADNGVVYVLCMYKLAMAIEARSVGDSNKIVN